LEALRDFCSRSSYKETLIDALFAKIMLEPRLDVRTLMSLLKTVSECRYTDPQVMDYLFKKSLVHVKQGIMESDQQFVAFLMRTLARNDLRENYDRLWCEVDCE